MDEQETRRRGPFGPWGGALGIVASVLFATTVVADVVIPRGAAWRYWDQADYPTNTWAEVTYDDSGWPSGPALLGYGDPDVVTTIGFGGISTNKHITSLYRHRFVLTNGHALTLAKLELLRDDGGIVYVNGTEVYRNNMPAGTISNLTVSADSGSDDEFTFFAHYFDPALLLSGTNAIAVEVHQHKPDTSDSRFNFSLATGTNTAPVLASYEIASLTATSAVLQAVIGSTGISETVVNAWWGPTPVYGDLLAWSNAASWSAVSVGDVPFPLSNLVPATRYYYRLQATNAAGDVWSDLGTFVTPPLSLAVIPWGTDWRYLDDGVDPGTAWRQPGFDDGLWAEGGAQLGYGDGDEQTVIGFGGDTSNKYMAAYFRNTFVVEDVARFAAMDLQILYDDGAIIYLNGNRLRRLNMPSGTVSINTPANGSAENVTWSRQYGNLLLEGTNVVAVEVHQRAPDSSDLSFDLSLTVLQDPLLQVARGPYVQLATPTGATLKWRTTSATNSRVRFGTAPGALDQSVVMTNLVTDHSVALSGLHPDHRYYYAIGTATEDLAGDDENHFGRTLPIPGATNAVRIWVIGDSGTANAASRATYEAYRDLDGRETDVWLMLGDNAYNDGTDAQYQAAVFETYPEMLRNTVAWSTLGNHETYNGQTFSATETGPYYDIFTLPRGGEAGGVASGTEAYYSFDYGKVHFICLDSMDTDRSVDGAMIQWLEEDLSQTRQEWLIAFWHHPPYTKGTHNSDNIGDSGGRMQDMRERVLPILESNRVDLVLNGHSHVYERSYYLNGHYGYSPSLNTNTMFTDGGDGRPDGDGAYTATLSNTGTVYGVCGSSGKTSASALNHPAMFYSIARIGSLVLDVDGNRLDGRFIDTAGIQFDHFSIVHDWVVDDDTDADSLPDWWEQWYFSNLQQSASTDFDGDGITDGEEFAGDMNPGQPLVVGSLAVTTGGVSVADIGFSWLSEPGRLYNVDMATSLVPPVTWLPTGFSNQPGLQGLTMEYDQAATNPASYFRIRAIVTP